MSRRSARAADLPAEIDKRLSARNFMLFLALAQNRYGAQFASSMSDSDGDDNEDENNNQQQNSQQQQVTVFHDGKPATDNSFLRLACARQYQPLLMALEFAAEVFGSDSSEHYCSEIVRVDYRVPSGFSCRVVYLHLGATHISSLCSSLARTSAQYKYTLKDVQRISGRPDIAREVPCRLVGTDPWDYVYANAANTDADQSTVARDPHQTYNQFLISARWECDRCSHPDNDPRVPLCEACGSDRAVPYDVRQPQRFRFHLKHNSLIEYFIAYDCLRRYSLQPLDDADERFVVAAARILIFNKNAPEDLREAVMQRLLVRDLHDPAQALFEVLEPQAWYTARRYGTESVDHALALQQIANAIGNDLDEVGNYERARGLLERAITIISNLIQSGRQATASDGENNNASNNKVQYLQALIKRAAAPSSPAAGGGAATSASSFSRAAAAGGGASASSVASPMSPQGAPLLVSTSADLNTELMDVLLLLASHVCNRHARFANDPRLGKTLCEEVIRLIEHDMRSTLLPRLSRAYKLLGDALADSDRTQHLAPHALRTALELAERIAKRHGSRLTEAPRVPDRADNTDGNNGQRQDDASNDMSHLSVEQRVELEDARRAYETSAPENAAREREDVERVALIYASMGRALLAKGGSSFSAGVTAFERALRIFTRYGVQRHEVVQALEVYATLVVPRDPAKAVTVLSRCLATKQQVYGPESVRNFFLHRLLAKAHDRAMSRQDAFAQCAQAVQIAGMTGMDPSDPMVREMGALFDKLKPRKPPSDDEGDNEEEQMNEEY